MARGETLGQRRRRRRRERHGGDPAFDPDPPITSPRRLAEAKDRELDALPAWARALWTTPGLRRGTNTHPYVVLVLGALVLLS